MRHYTADEIRDLPTLATGQADNLKIDTGEMRVWLCRCGIADGMSEEDMITIEELQDGCWITVSEYPG